MHTIPFMPSFVLAHPNQPIGLICHEQRNVQHIVIQFQVIQREAPPEGGCLSVYGCCVAKNDLTNGGKEVRKTAILMAGDTGLEPGDVSFCPYFLE